jgi:hypothetical protein
MITTRNVFGRDLLDRKIPLESKCDLAAQQTPLEPTVWNFKERSEMGASSGASPENVFRG